MKQATFTAYVNDSGKEVQFTVVNPTDDQIKMIGKTLLITRVELEQDGGTHPMSAHACPGPPECM